MPTPLKLFFSLLMITALCFGFADIYFPLERFDLERLHIFLFNLCTGGTILLLFTEDRGGLSRRTGNFLGLSLVYALSAFLELYPITIVLSLVLAGIVESIRVEKFSFFPGNFFSLTQTVSGKFHQAALLCLSLGLVLSSVVIVNNEYLHLVHMEKLVLNTFFLGFSFPLSLITLSVIFSMIQKGKGSMILLLATVCFWVINLGVIIFFVFILFERFYPQIAVTLALFMAVVTVLLLYLRLGSRIQQKQFLSSGIGFLIFTAVSGIVYIFLQMDPGYDPERSRWLLRVHTFASLYGWNLCGLAVICRYDDFPIRLNSGVVIAVHWLTALVLAPLGTFYPVFAIFAVLSYIFIVWSLFFSTNQ
ncbi:conserved hypothetical protein [Desulforapulum autotrophicum HRM2]|uniref:Uncharacterized protein n=1 Tax=Desulforapulum autotrophicum (strain ATCC 43914 / DSM 3382 / VKM B-1955 / HRM2) TaxID=177437 RepID=C0QCC2_DESAH|nr:hypothetical protein [Desulforapulum autotrophicum]ACN17139.1 conserved hypothetical protein [Desulforapulum autotrophicum HRM2]